jgi:3D (Asp-Asp-Asp) domain-containing protein
VTRSTVRKAVFLFVLAWAAIIYSWIAWNVRALERAADERMEAIETQMAVTVATYAEPEPDEADKPPYLGEFKISFYTPAADENGGYDGITVTGDPIIPGETAAVAHGTFPLGTVVYIDTIGYRTISDYGCREGYIDVAVETKKEAFELGVYDASVWLCMEAQS